MTTLDLGGVLAIPVTPFDSTGRIDRAALTDLVETFIHHGANVIVGPVFVSEFYTLSDAECDAFLETVIAASAGRVPVMAGVSRPGVEIALEAARRAVAAGADALIAMPPYVRAPSTSELVDFYLRIGEVSQGRPLMIQNAPQPPGAQMSVPQLRSAIEQSSAPIWVKEETTRAVAIMAELTDNPPATLGGVVGGIGGFRLLEEVAHGSRGTMPSGEFIDMHVLLWKSLAEHGPAHGRSIELYTALLPLLVLEGLYGISFCKEVLVMRGALASTALREPNATPLDDATLRIIDRHLRYACEVFGVNVALR